MKASLACSIAVTTVVIAALSDQKVLWVANCGDTVGSLPAGMGDTFGSLNSAAVTDVNSIYAGSTYIVPYITTASQETWSYTLSEGNTFLVSRHDPATCTAGASTDGNLPFPSTATATAATSLPDCCEKESTRAPLQPIATTQTKETWTGSKATMSAPTGAPQASTVPTTAQNVVYWGQHGAGVPENDNLAAYCTKEAAIDIIVLAFLFKFGKGNTIPSGVMGNSCVINPSGEGQQCDALAKAIDTCKSNGVKIILSLGGAAGDYSLSSQQEAEAIGQNLWDAYGNTKTGGRVPRPFGKTFVDGWDFNIEHNSGNSYYAFLIARLRSNFASDPGTQYFITGAPQCPVPEPNMNEIITTAQFDYLWIQFYNNPGCSVDTTINYVEWKEKLAGTPSGKAKIFIGVPAHPLAANGADSGKKYYLEPGKLASLVVQYKSDPAFGGVMMWAAGLSDANRNSGCTYAQEAKRILTEGKIC